MRGSHSLTKWNSSATCNVGLLKNGSKANSVKTLVCKVSRLEYKDLCLMNVENLKQST